NAGVNFPFFPSAPGAAGLGFLLPRFRSRGHRGRGGGGSHCFRGGAVASVINDVNPRKPTRPPRGIMRVVVVIATVLGLAGVMGFAPGTGGELRREAAGVMPIVDAGNYVGTELGERLSNNGGMDLSWPMPEGFDGI